MKSNGDLNTVQDPLDIEAVISFFWKNRWTFLVVAVLGFVLSLAGTLWMTPKYRTTATLYATQTNSSKTLLENQQFGFDIDADRLIQVLQSDRIMDSIVRKFDLTEHYHIDTHQIDWRDQLLRAYYSNITFSRTAYMSVVVSVMDTDPVKGAAIANSIVDMVDKVRSEMLKKNSKKALDWLEAEYFAKLLEVRAMGDSLAQVQNSTISRYESTFRQEYTTSQGRIRELINELNAIRKSYRIQDLDGQLTLLNEKMEQARLEAANIEGKLVVMEAVSGNDSMVAVLKSNLSGVNKEMQEIVTRMGELNPAQKDFSFLQKALERENQLSYRLNDEFRRLKSFPNQEMQDIRLNLVRNAYEYEIVLLNEMKKEYEAALSNYKDPIPETYKINRAYPSYKKAAPILWINLVIGTMFPLGFCMILILFLGKFRDMKRKYH
ncbi:MAG: hypothetical protein H6581_13420 [Bacteroidia bacterium]|nr:hypothetical protein [Bacteroidia bacterium]